MPRIADNLNRIQQKLGSECQLVVVSKFRTVEEIEEVYACGQRIFAENRVQALIERYHSLPTDIEWHLIGHLQTNKVKYISPFIAMIHSVDSFKLLKEINTQGIKNNRVIDCLIQVFVATEDTKFGLDRSELLNLMEEGNWKSMVNVRICGIMAMASLTQNQQQIDREFAEAAGIFQMLKQKYFIDEPQFKELSLGMSSDYELALKHNSTLVRIGTAVFE